MAQSGLYVSLQSPPRFNRKDPDRASRDVYQPLTALTRIVEVLPNHPEIAFPSGGEYGALPALVGAAWMLCVSM